MSAIKDNIIERIQKTAHRAFEIIQKFEFEKEVKT